MLLFFQNLSRKEIQLNGKWMKEETKDMDKGEHRQTIE